MDGVIDHVFGLVSNFFTMFAAGSQAFGLAKIPPKSGQMHSLSRLERSGADILTAKVPKLIPVAKQEEYIAAFGSQTKLPRTPLLPGH